MRRAPSVVIAAFLGVALCSPQVGSASDVGDDQVPLQQWSPPLYWQPSAPERSSAKGASVALVSAPPALPMPYVAITPCRLIDTRSTSAITGEWGPPSLVAETGAMPVTSDRLFTGTGASHCEVPAGAQALSVIVTAIGYAGSGRFTIYPSNATSRPSIATVNYVLATGIANVGTVLPLGADGKIRVFSNQAADIIVDVNGYYAPDPGGVVVSAGFGNWKPFNSTDPVSWTYFSSQTQVTRSTAGSGFLSVNPDMTPVLLGRSLSLVGVEFCYDTFASTTLNYIEINTYSHTTGVLGRNLRYSDSTSRTGNECRTYTLPSPVPLTANDGVNIFIQVNWSVAAAQFAIGRTSFILAPGGSAALPLAATRPDGELSPARPSQGPVTSAPE